MNRDLSRRLSRLETDRAGPGGIRYTISDRVLTNQEWELEMAGELVPDEPHEATPILTEAQWLDAYCTYERRPNRLACFTEI